MLFQFLVLMEMKTSVIVVDPYRRRESASPPVPRVATGIADRRAPRRTRPHIGAFQTAGSGKHSRAGRCFSSARSTQRLQDVANFRFRPSVFPLPIPHRLTRVLNSRDQGPLHHDDGGERRLQSPWRKKGGWYMAIPRASISEGAPMPEDKENPDRAPSLCIRISLFCPHCQN